MYSNYTMFVTKRGPSESRVGPASTTSSTSSARMCCRSLTFYWHCQHTLPIVREASLIRSSSRMTGGANWVIRASLTAWQWRSTHQRSQTSARKMPCVTGMLRLCGDRTSCAAAAGKKMTAKRTRTQKTVTVTWQMPSPGWRSVPMCESLHFLCLYICYWLWVYICYWLCYWLWVY